MQSSPDFGRARTDSRSLFMLKMLPKSRREVRPRRDAGAIRLFAVWPPGGSPQGRARSPQARHGGRADSGERERLRAGTWGGRIADMLRNKRFQKGIFAAEGLVRLERNPALQMCPSCFGRLFSARLLAGFAPTVDI